MARHLRLYGAMEFYIPSRTHNDRGQERRVGFEFEFSGVDTRETAAIVAELFGGKIEETNRFDIKVAGTRLGDFSVALDARAIKEEKYLKLLKKLGVEVHLSEKREWWEDLLENVVSIAIPYEIGTPPVPLSQMHEIEKLREVMRKRHALGTTAKTQYAFGMHLNPEVPDRGHETVLAVLRSFLLHYPWLLKEMEIDLARRVAPFINPFPDAYLELVLPPSYRPGQEQMIRDYLEHNPTRNRPLDLLPIFCLWNEKIVRDAMPEEKIKARPTFHYRLPNCLFDEPDWRLAQDWNHWVRVENMAFHPERLDRLAEELLLEMHASPLSWNSRWSERFQKEQIRD